MLGLSFATAKDLPDQTLLRLLEEETEHMFSILGKSCRKDNGTLVVFGKKGTGPPGTL